MKCQLCPEVQGYTYKPADFVNMETKLAGIKMADNITLHTFDEIADYFKNTPYGAKNKDNILVTHDDRVFIRTMIAMPGLNRHGWGMDEQFIPYNIGTIKGVPLTFALQKDRTNSAGPQVTFPHPTINNAPHIVNEGFQDAYIIGKYLGHEDKPDANRVWHGLAEVTNEKAKEYYGNLYLTEQEGTFPTTVSPQVLHYKNEESNRHALRRWWYQHVTITDDPAYPPEYARISSACIGTEDKCIPEIKKAGPDIQLNEHQAPVYHVVDVSNCPICVKDALKELTNPRPENSSLIAKSASFDKIMNNENNSGNTQTAGLDGNQTGGTNAQTGALSTAQTVNESKPTILPEVKKPEGGYSAELEVKNLPQVIEKIIQEQMAKYLNENKPLNVPETNITPKSKKSESEGEEKKDEEEKKKDENTPLTAREKALLERVTKSEGEVAKLAEQERKRGIELVLASVNDGKQFIDGKTKKFDDKKFQGQVDYWMDTKLQPEAVEKQIKTMIDLVGGLAVESKEEVKKDEPQPNRAYASMAENKAAIYGVGDLNANNNTNQDNVETKNASMSGGLMVKEPYFIQLERRTVLRSDPIGQVE